MAKKILVVDDEVDFCYFIKNNLELSGEFEVTTCSDSTRAVQIAQQLRPHLILVDIMMPGISGEDIVAELQNNPNTRNIPYIFLTGIITEGEVSDDYDTIAGHHFVAKPVEIKTLIPLMNRLIKFSNIPE